MDFRGNVIGRVTIDVMVNVVVLTIDFKVNAMGYQDLMQSTRE